MGAADQRDRLEFGNHRIGAEFKTFTRTLRSFNSMARFIIALILSVIGGAISLFSPQCLMA